jgi:hypothetical protein
MAPCPVEVKLGKGVAMAASQGIPAELLCMRMQSDELP